MQDEILSKEREEDSEIKKRLRFEGLLVN